MGTEYYLYNHANATYYELGKGPFGAHIIDTHKKDLYNAEAFLDVLKKEWNSFSTSVPEDDRIKYFTLIAQDLQAFVKDTPEDQIQCFGDNGDEDLWADWLKYEFVGTRYGLGSPDHETYMKEMKNRILEDQVEADLTLDFSEREIKIMKVEGWNFKHRESA
jgi:hypothetical protein